MSKSYISLFVFLCFLSISFQEDYKSFILKLGLDLEEGQITTEDRYINTVWILSSKDKSKKNGRSIILQHGLLDGAWTWLILGKKSLAFLLAEEGYNVYLHYIRGSQFSSSHLDYGTGINSDYWNFSFDEMAKYDLPALIEYVKKKDKVEKVDYIGHSQGTLIFFLAYMNDPAYLENNINRYISIGTVPNVNNAPHFLIKLFEKSNILNFIPIKNFLTFPPEIGQVITPFCTGLAKSLCDSILKIAFSGLKDTGRVDYDVLDKYIFLYEPGGTSLQNMKHWIQIYSVKRTQKYDYGSKLENLKHYGTINPPAYDLSKMKSYSIPSIFTISDSDPFCNPDDTLEFIDKISKKDIVRIRSFTNYNHIDYLWAEDAYNEFYPEILSFLKE